MRRVPAETQFAQFQAASAEKEEGGMKSDRYELQPGFVCSVPS